MDDLALQHRCEGQESLILQLTERVDFSRLCCQPAVPLQGTEDSASTPSILRLLLSEHAGHQTETPQSMCCWASPSDCLSRPFKTGVLSALSSADAHIALPQVAVLKAAALQRLRQRLQGERMSHRNWHTLKGRNWRYMSQHSSFQTIPSWHSITK